MGSSEQGAPAYRVFVSHADADKHLARAVTRSIREAFGGRIEPYLAVEAVVGGVEWKEELKEKLRTCDAIVTLITRESVHKRWLYIEWSPFWLDEKKFYVLVSDDVRNADLVEPMTATQLTRIQDPSSVEKLLRALHADAGLGGVHPVPVDRVPAFVAEAAAGMRADVAVSVDRYADPSAEPPADGAERWRVLEYFYAKGELGTFRAIARRTANDAFQADVAIWALKRSDAATARALADDIRSAEHLGRVAWKMVEAGVGDGAELRHVLDLIQGRNNAELRKLAVELLDHGRDDTDAFRYSVRIMSNMAELRKVAIRLIQRGEQEKPVFHEIVERMSRSNRTPLRDLGDEFLRLGTQRAPEFARLLELLVTSDKPSLALPVLEELRRADPGMLPALHARFRRAVAADNPALAWLAGAVGAEATA